MKLTLQVSPNIMSLFADLDFTPALFSYRRKVRINVKVCPCLDLFPYRMLFTYTACIVW